MRRLLAMAFCLIISSPALSGPNYQGGTITDLTAITSGIMIRLDSGVPDNCKGTPHGWMLVKQEHTAITSTVLTAWTSGNKSITVYTSGRGNSGSEFCEITQFDPAN